MEAYAQYAQDAPPKLAPHKTLPRCRPATGDIFPAAQLVRLLSATGTESETSPRLSIRTRSPLGSPILLDGESALPPTPPSASRDTLHNGVTDGPRKASGSLRALSLRHSGLSTPTTGRSPPTPDITPPTGQHLRPPIPSPLISAATSRAESFQTAREEQQDWSSDDGGYTNYTLSGGRDASTRAYMEATRALSGLKGLGFDYEHEDGDSTPTQDHQQKLDQPLRLPKLRGPGTSVKNATNKALDSPKVADQGWDGDRMRNVTLRRKKVPRTPPGLQQARAIVEPQSSHVDHSESPNANRTPERDALLRPMEVAKGRVFSEPTHILHRSSRSIDIKRLSDISSTSTVVEAVIRIATPQYSSRKLRHVSKIAGLRSLSGSAIDVAQTSPAAASRSDGGSAEPDGTPPRKLHHKRASISKKVEHRQDATPEKDTSPVLKRPLRHSRDYSHLRPGTGSSTNSATARLDSSPHKLRKVAEFEASPRMSDLAGTTAELPEYRVSTEATSRHHSQSPSPIVAEQPSGDEAGNGAVGQEQSEVIGTVQGAQQEVTPSSNLPQPKSALKSRPEKLELGPFPYTQQPPSPIRNRAPSASTVESQQQLMPVVPLQMQQHARAMRARYSSDAASGTEDYRRVSFGDETLSPHDAPEHFPRKSADSRRSLAPTIDESVGSPGYSSLYPPITPLSVSSMRSEAHIAEARAVNFYPHTNESLLYIQHGSMEPSPAKLVTYPRLNGSPVMQADLHRAIDAIENPSTPTPPPTRVTTAAETEDILYLTPPGSATHPPLAPQLLVEPSTPTSPMAPFEIDSPLRNPRSAPQPPAFKVIPPTPFSEADDPFLVQQTARQQPDTSQVTSLPPARRVSLMQRARRYSDSYIQPLFNRPVSVKRVVRPATGNDAAARDRGLHPFWRPRGFWDDFSDSDSDDEFWGDGEPTYADEDETQARRRLPQGGDTSDVRSLEQQRPAVMTRMGSVRKVIMDGFRGSGGFLIGNSLGFERAGTNRRRHHISLPARLQGRYAPNRGIATLPAHVTDRYSTAGAAHHYVARHEEEQTSLAGTQRLAPGGPGFTHNPTQPLSVLSAPTESSQRTPSRTVSLSSFPSNYTSTAASKRRRKGWRRNIQFPFRVEYVGLRGMTERLRERKAEKRREDLRRQIGRGVLQDGAKGYENLRNL